MHVYCNQRRHPIDRERGNLLVELSFVLPILLLILFSTLEIVSYMRQRQLVQSASREGALRAYKECSGYSDLNNPTDIARATRCLADVAGEVRTLPGAANATIDLGLFRCVDPVPSGPPCVPTLISSGGTISPWSGRLATPGDPLTQLIRSQGVAVVFHIEWPVTSATGVASWLNSVRGQFSKVSDVSIL